MLKFKMDPREDLSNRADFTYDLMAAISRKAQAAVESSKELAELKSKAKVGVRAHGSLSSISVDITITPTGDTELPEAELEAANKAVAETVNAAIKESMSEMLQESMAGARKRM